MYEILIYLTDNDYADEVNALFSEGNLQTRIADDLNEAIRLSAEELFDLVLVWPADFENTRIFLETLEKNELDYMPVVTLLDNDDHLQNILSLKVADYIRLPIPRDEFLNVINGIMADLDVQATVMEGMNWQGNLEEYNLVDLFQLIDDSQNDAELTLSCSGVTANLYFKRGNIVHAELMNSKGEFALHKIVFWSRGNFQIKFSKHFSVENSVKSSNQEVLLLLMHDLSEWDRFYRGLPDVFEELLTNPFVESSTISSIQNVILRKCKNPISIFRLLLELEEENWTIVQEIKKLLEANLVGRRREIESLIIQERERKGLAKFIKAFSFVLGRKQEVEEVQEADLRSSVENTMSRIEFKPVRLKDEEKESIIAKIESWN